MKEEFATRIQHATQTNMVGVFHFVQLQAKHELNESFEQK